MEKSAVPYLSDDWTNGKMRSFWWDLRTFQYQISGCFERVVKLNFIRHRKILNVNDSIQQLRRRVSTWMGDTCDRHTKEEWKKAAGPFTEYVALSFSLRYFSVMNLARFYSFGFVLHMTGQLSLDSKAVSRFRWYHQRRIHIYIHASQNDRWPWPRTEDLNESNESMTVAGNILIRLKSLNRSLTMNAVWHPSLMTAVTIPDIRFNLVSVHSRAHPIDTIRLTLQQSICGFEDGDCTIVTP